MSHDDKSGLLEALVQELRKSARTTSDPRYCNILLLDETEELVARVLNATPSDASPINQCDGCQRGLPLNEHGNHYEVHGGKQIPVIACTKDRYSASASADRPTIGERLRRKTTYTEAIREHRSDPRS